VDSQGNAVLPTSAVTSCVVASFTTISASSVVTVALPNHGYSVGSTYPVLVETAVGGVTLNGAYDVQTVPSTDAFTIIGQNSASLSATVFINNGLARYNFYVGAGPLPAAAAMARALRRWRLRHRLDADDAARATPSRPTSGPSTTGASC
jgi:hypothetical protein